MVQAQQESRGDSRPALINPLTEGSHARTPDLPVEAGLEEVQPSIELGGGAGREPARGQGFAQGLVDTGETWGARQTASLQPCCRGAGLLRDEGAVLAWWDDVLAKLLVRPGRADSRGATGSSAARFA